MTQRTSAQGRRLPIIAIDGPAGAGKTTTAKEVARRLNFIHLDTGAMYRAIALKALRSGSDLGNPRDLAALVESTDVEIRHVNGIQRVFLDGVDVTDTIRTPEVSRAVSPVSEVREVRNRMVALQRKLGESGGIVAEGRDIGTVVFPDAELKIFLTAGLKERTRRRHLDLEKLGLNADPEVLETQIVERDLRDQNRDNSPLKKAADAIVIDTTNLSFEEQVLEIIRHYTARCGLPTD